MKCCGSTRRGSSSDCQGAVKLEAWPRELMRVAVRRVGPPRDEARAPVHRMAWTQVPSSEMISRCPGGQGGEIDAGGEFEGPVRDLAENAFDGGGAGDEVGVGVRAFACGAPRGVEVKGQGVGSGGGVKERAGQVCLEDSDGVLEGKFAGVELGADGADFGELDGDDGVGVGQGEGVAADTGAEVGDKERFGVEGGETPGFVACYRGGGGLFEGFGDAPEPGHGGEFGVVAEGGFAMDFGQD